MLQLCPHLLRRAAAALCVIAFAMAGHAKGAGMNDADVEPGADAGGTSGAMIESRGVWLGREEMLEGREKLVARLDRLSTGGLNTVYINTQFRGYVLYPDSRILPQYPEIARSDARILDWLIPAIHERGMRAEAWTEYGFFAYYTPDKDKDQSRGVLLDKTPGLTAISEDGEPWMRNEKLGYFYALCPANPESHKILASLYVEMLGKYPFDGLNLDRIRFFDRRFCHCDYCKKTFLERTGVELAKFDEGSTAVQAWREWRKERTREFVKGLAASVRAAHPGKSITSAVVSPDLIDDKGQDWPSWMRAGYLDAAMPMLYARDISASIRFIEENLPPSARVFYGIDAAQGWDTFSGQIEDLRARKASGITIWYAVPLDQLLPRLAAGPFARPAASPLAQGAQLLKAPSTGDTTAGANTLVPRPSAASK